MSQVIKTLNGVGWVQAGNGVGPIIDFSGPNPSGPVIGIMIICRQIGPGIQNIYTGLTVAPNGGGSSGQFSGTPFVDDESGDYGFYVSVFWAYYPSVEYPHRWLALPGFGDFPNGLLASDVTGVSTQQDAANYDFEVWLQYSDPNVPEDWSGSPPSENPSNANIQHVESDTLDEFAQPTGDKDETFTWDIPTEDLVGTIIQRDGETIASLDAGIGTYVDIVTPGNTYIYTWYFYYLNGSGISESFEYEVESSGAFTEPPLLDMTMGGGINFGGAPLITMIVNPSGIYTLVENLHHDRLYERITGITYVDVKIPDPFIKSAFLLE